MSNETVRSIRRIVRGTPDAPEGIGAAEDVKSIGTSRGIGFVNARGDVTGGGSEGGPDANEKPDTSPPPTDDPEDNDTGGQGGQNTPGDPNDDPTTDAEGNPVLTGDVKTVFDAATTGATWGSVGGTVNGSTTCLETHALAPVEFDSPPTWESPDDPPLATEHTGATITTGNSCSILSCPSSNTKGFRGSTVWDKNTGFSWTIGYFTLAAGNTQLPAGFSFENNCTSCPADADFGRSARRAWEV